MRPYTALSDLWQVAQLDFPNPGTEQGNGNRTITAYFSIRQTVPEKSFGSEKEES